MPCTSSVFAYNAPCDPSPGGIKAILIADPDAVRVSTVWPNSGTIALAAAKNGAKPFYRWEVAPKQCTLQTEAKIIEANNVRFFSTDLVVALNGFKPGTAGSQLLQRLYRLAIIVELNNDSAVFLGLVDSYNSDLRPDAYPHTPRGADVTAFTWTPGQEKGDAIRATLTAHLDSYQLPLTLAYYNDLVNS